MTNEMFKEVVRGMKTNSRWGQGFNESLKLTKKEREYRGELIREIKAASPFVGANTLSLYDLEDVKRSQYSLLIARLSNPA